MTSLYKIDILKNIVFRLSNKEIFAHVIQVNGVIHSTEMPAITSYDLNIEIWVVNGSIRSCDNQPVISYKENKDFKVKLNYNYDIYFNGLYESILQYYDIYSVLQNSNPDAVIYNCVSHTLVVQHTVTYSLTINKETLKNFSDYLFEHHDGSGLRQKIIHFMQCYKQRHMIINNNILQKLILLGEYHEY